MELNRLVRQAHVEASDELQHRDTVKCWASEIHNLGARDQRRCSPV